MFKKGMRVRLINFQYTHRAMTDGDYIGTVISRRISKRGTIRVRRDSHADAEEWHTNYWTKLFDYSKYLIT